MTEGGAGTLAEHRLPGPVPRWEIPGWRERFGVVAGVTGRGEGHGTAGFDLGLWTGQPVGEVSTRWREFLRTEAGFHGAVLSHQVHGTRLAWHAMSTAGWTVMGGADGHLTNQRGLLLLVTVADCIPVYLLDPSRGLVGLLHAGWRGVAGGILGLGVQALAEAGGGSRADFVMHCGIGISDACYEVGDEVATACGKAPSPTGKQQLDLRRALAEQGRQLGIAEITVSPHCTATMADSFFSHRRSGGVDGRQVAYLGWPTDQGRSTIL